MRPFTDASLHLARFGIFAIGVRFADIHLLSMKSNRMRLSKPFEAQNRLNTPWNVFSSKRAIDIRALPPPLPIPKVDPDKVIEDVLVATLKRVQRSAKPEIAAAAARYLSLLIEDSR
jgi:hypothetical protein